jgi:hypothetical protein
MMSMSTARVLLRRRVLGPSSGSPRTSRPLFLFLPWAVS